MFLLNLRRCTETNKQTKINICLTQLGSNLYRDLISGTNLKKINIEMK